LCLLPQDGGKRKERRLERAPGQRHSRVPTGVRRGEDPPSRKATADRQPAPCRFS
jgi:hypothetical protein